MRASGVYIGDVTLRNLEVTVSFALVAEERQKCAGLPVLYKHIVQSHHSWVTDVQTEGWTSLGDRTESSIVRQLYSIDENEDVIPVV